MRQDLDTKEKYDAYLDTLEPHQREVYEDFMSKMGNGTETVTDQHEIDVLNSTIDMVPPMVEGNRYNPDVYWVNDTVFARLTESEQYIKIHGHDVVEDLI